MSADTAGVRLFVLTVGASHDAKIAEDRLSASMVNENAIARTVEESLFVITVGGNIDARNVPRTENRRNNHRNN